MFITAPVCCTWYLLVWRFFLMILPFNISLASCPVTLTLWSCSALVLPQYLSCVLQPYSAIISGIACPCPTYIVKMYILTVIVKFSVLDEAQLVCFEAKVQVGWHLVMWHMWLNGGFPKWSASDMMVWLCTTLKKIPSSFSCWTPYTDGNETIQVAASSIPTIHMAQILFIHCNTSGHNSIYFH